MPNITLQVDQGKWNVLVALAQAGVGEASEHQVIYAKKAHQAMTELVTTHRDQTQEVADLYERMSNGEEVIKEAMEREKALEERIANQKETIEDLRAVRTAFQNNQGKGEAGEKGKEKKMKDPPLFDGNRDEIENFILQLRLNLAEETSFKNEQAKLRYIVSLLKGKALYQLAPRVKKDKVDLEDAEEAIQILETAFGDPDPQTTALEKLRRCYQNNKDFAEYYAEYFALISKLDWDEKAKIDRLNEGLSNEMKDALVVVKRPKTLAECIQLYQEIDKNIQARKKSKQRRTGPTEWRPRMVSQPATAPPPANPSSQPMAPHPTASNSGYYGPAPMDLSAGKRGPITTQERLRRLENNLCMYCGGPGHMARNCPVSAENAKRRQGTGQVIAALKARLEEEKKEQGGEEQESKK